MYFLASVLDLFRERVKVHIWGRNKLEFLRSTHLKVSQGIKPFSSALKSFKCTTHWDGNFNLQHWNYEFPTSLTTWVAVYRGDWGRRRTRDRRSQRQCWKGCGGEREGCRPGEAKARSHSQSGAKGMRTRASWRRPSRAVPCLPGPQRLSPAQLGSTDSNTNGRYSDPCPSSPTSTVSLSLTELIPNLISVLNELKNKSSLGREKRAWFVKLHWGAPR